MNVEDRMTTVGIAATVFVVFIAGLTALRLWQLQPSDSVQSLIVQVTAFLVVVSIAYYSYRGGGLVESWILAFGPSQAFTLTLFLSGPTAGVLPVLGYAIVSAVLLAGTLGVLGFSLGRAGARISGTESNTTPV